MTDVELVWPPGGSPSVVPLTVWRLRRAVRTNMTDARRMSDAAVGRAAGRRVGWATPETGHQRLFCAEVGRDGEWVVRWVDSRQDLERLTRRPQHCRSCGRRVLPADSRHSLARCDAHRGALGLRLVRQPADGSCFFHSVAYHLDRPASVLRADLARWVRANLSCEIEGHPLSTWIEWEGAPVETYLARLASGAAWGGATEVAALTRMDPSLKVVVYHRRPGRGGGGYERVVQSGDGPKEVLLCWSDGHYDALVRTSASPSK